MELTQKKSIKFGGGAGPELLSPPWREIRCCIRGKIYHPYYLVNYIENAKLHGKLILNTKDNA